MNCVSRMKKRIIALVLLFGLNPGSYSQDSGDINLMGNPGFRLKSSTSGITEFRVKEDTVNFLPPNGVWGEVQVRYRVNYEDWNSMIVDRTRITRLNDQTLLYTDSLNAMPLCMKRFFRLTENGLSLRIELSTTGKQAVELGDVSLPVRWRIPGNGKDDSPPSSIFEGGFIKMNNISLNSSFLTFSKPSGEGPYYIMLTGDNTSLEYFDNVNRLFKVYVHSTCTGNTTEGNWRLPHTSKILNPAGKEGDKVVYEFLLTAVPRYEDLRDIVFRQRLLDVRAAPGYTVPQDLSAKLAFRLQGHIDSIVSEFPGQTEIRSAGTGPNGALLYEVRFLRLGENLLTVHYNNGKRSILEFFSCEPLETLIRKRSSFIVNRQQHKAPGKWWDGLYSVYDMKYGKLRGPEDTDGFDGWYGYVLSCDDPGLSKAPFVAAKNVVYPDSSEIASLEYHLENFVWGKLQRTDKEKPYPYGVYGVPNWYVSRDSMLHASIFPNDGNRMQIWRAYDYVHIAKLYYHMFQIATYTPQWTHYLDAEGYFERAVQTIKAYFNYPYEILPWFDTYKWGCYNEWIIPDVIAGLVDRGRKADADLIRGEWEKKAKYFIYDDKYPYRSEYNFDRTAFESSYALARYAIEYPMKPDKRLWFDKNKKIWYSHAKVSPEDGRAFMKRQHYAGLAVRGWQAPKYFLAGTDCPYPTHTFDMSYMAIMGGWSVLEYGLYYSKTTDWVELGYNSYLSSWSLMNTGNQESNYGYWYPGIEKDGASGWAFVSAKSGNTWLRKQENRGVWRYDGEIDLGYGAAFHTARTIVIWDSVYGLHAYGGELEKSNSMLSVVPRDGVRQQFSYVMNDRRFHVTLERDGFLKDSSLLITSNGKQFNFVLENRACEGSSIKYSKMAHSTLLQIRTEKMFPKHVIAGGRSIPVKATTTGWEVHIPVQKDKENVIIEWK